jgi:hypothetical protein
LTACIERGLLDLIGRAMAPASGAFSANSPLSELLFTVATGISGMLLGVAPVASAMASLESGRGAALKKATPLAPAINPQTRNVSGMRQKLEVPIYPNSGCEARTGDTTTLVCPETLLLS